MRFIERPHASHIAPIVLILLVASPCYRSIFTSLFILNPKVLLKFNDDCFCLWEIHLFLSLNIIIALDLRIIHVYDSIDVLYDYLGLAEVN